MLGKLHPSHFPYVFGPNADEPLDKDVVEQKFRLLAKTISESIGEKEQSPHELAEGFLRIAVENMANAIKKISVQRGYDVTSYTLQCFGGAGGQHACLVADALGMERIFIHPFAGVLSAYGMGLADVRHLKEQQFERPLSDHEDALKVLQKLAQDAEQKVILQGIAAKDIRIEYRAHMRLEGSHQSLEIDFGTKEELLKRFDAAHRARYGFSAVTNDVIFEALAVEAIGGASEIREEKHPLSEKCAKPTDHIQIIISGYSCLLYTSPSPRD